MTEITQPQVSKKVCSYCGEPRKLTKEHIWPASIIRKVADRASYNPKAGRLLWTEMVINDVCEPCNNGPLSILDTYGAKLFDKYFSNYYLGDEPLTFEYDYQRLAKWLLKLSFNAARANQSDHVRLAQYCHSLLNANCDLPEDLSIAVDLLKPEAIDPEKEPVLPASNRICRISFSEPIDDWCTVRLVAINSFYFWILIQDVPDIQVNLDHAKAVLSKIRGTRLDEKNTSAVLGSSGSSILDVHSHWAEALRNTKFPERK